MMLTALIPALNLKLDRMHMSLDNKDVKVTNV